MSLVRTYVKAQRNWLVLCYIAVVVTVTLLVAVR